MLPSARKRQVRKKEGSNVPRAELQQLRVSLGIARSVTIPAWTVDSGVPGPYLLAVAAQHGNEVQGSEAIRRFVEIVERDLTAGRVAAVPFANLSAVRERRPHVGMGPEQAYEDDGGCNMNRAWPGRPDGNIGERIAYAIYDVFGQHATHVVDIHCWQKHAAPGILIHDLLGMRELAAQLGSQFIHIRPHSDQTLAGYFGTTDRPGITYECSGQYTLVEERVREALRVIVNLARVLGMLPGDRELVSPVLFSDAYKPITVNAPTAGLFQVAPLSLGQQVLQGDVLGHILQDRNLERRTVVSPADGYLLCHGVSRPKCDVAMHGHHPYVTKGDMVAVVWEPLR